MIFFFPHGGCFLSIALARGPGSCTISCLRGTGETWINRIGLYCRDVGNELIGSADQIFLVPGRRKRINRLGVDVRAGCHVGTACVWFVRWTRWGCWLDPKAWPKPRLCVGPLSQFTAEYPKAWPKSRLCVDPCRGAVRGPAVGGEVRGCKSSA